MHYILTMPFKHNFLVCRQWGVFSLDISETSIGVYNAMVQCISLTQTSVLKFHITWKISMEKFTFTP